MSSNGWNGRVLQTTTDGESASSTLQRTTSSSRPRKSNQSRQLLSCTKCRERKVRCDRTKPCSACCARGHPKDCEFLVSEHGDLGPILQSVALRMLREDNARLRERLQSIRHVQTDVEHDEIDLVSSPRTSAKTLASRSRRFKQGERIDNLYFGTPGLANVASDFARLHVRQESSSSLTHILPRGRDIFSLSDDPPLYPFFSLGQGTHSAVEMARQLLQQHSDVIKHLEQLHQRVSCCNLPHALDLISRREVEQFLRDVDGNATRYPDILALIFITLACGMQVGTYDQQRGLWVPGSVEASRRGGDVYLAAAMEALRCASFMNSPTLPCVQTLLMMGPYLTNSGRFLDAWTLFGTTIRVAQSMGLHRKPEDLDPTPSMRQCLLRRKLWWSLLHFDQQYSVTLGRPLGISGIGDCSPPEPLSINPATLRLSEFVDYFTVLARTILASEGLVSVFKIDELTDKLLGLWDTMPETLQFKESWCSQDFPLPDWPQEMTAANLFAHLQSYILLLNRQRVERTQNNSFDALSPDAFASQSRRASTSNDRGSRSSVARGRDLVIKASISIVQVFLFFYHRSQANLISWTIGQQAFNASMILLLDAWETFSEENEALINQAYAVFVYLQTNGVHQLATLAVRQISDGLTRLGTRRRERDQTNKAQHDRLASGLQRSLLTIDTAPMPDFSGDSVMGNTGMFLLEDYGLQSYRQPSFHAMDWDASEGLDFLETTTTAAPVLEATETSIPYSPIMSACQPPTSSFQEGPPSFAMIDLQMIQAANHNVATQSQRNLLSQSTRYAPYSISARSVVRRPHLPVTHDELTARTPASHVELNLAQTRASRPNSSGNSRSRVNSGSGTSSMGPRGIHRPERSSRTQQRRK